MTMLILKLIIIVAVTCVVVTLLHEAGHYIIATLVGLKPDKFIIGRTGKVIFNNGKLIMTAIPVSGAVWFNDNKLANADTYQRRLIAVAGPAVNIILGLIALAITMDIFSIVGIFGFISLFTGVGNLIPIQTKEVTSDGYWALN